MVAVLHMVRMPCSVADENGTASNHIQAYEQCSSTIKHWSRAQLFSSSQLLMCQILQSSAGDDEVDCTVCKFTICRIVEDCYA